MKRKTDSLMFSAFKKVGQHQHFNRFDLFYPSIVGQKQGGFWTAAASRSASGRRMA